MARPAARADLSRESTPQYWARKHRELAVLARHAGCAPPLPVATGDELLHAKRALRARMLARFFLDQPALTESNLTGNLRVPFAPAPLAYKYQRFDLTLEHRPFIEHVYRLRWAKRSATTGLLTSSGMAAVTLALTAVDRAVPPGTPLVLPADCYFETARYARCYLERVSLTPATEATGPRVLFVDSSAVRDPTTKLSPARLRGALAVLFDTTCYPADDPRIRRAVDACLAARVPCLLLRSHLKLDCLATEYSRLGSVVLVVSRSASRSALDLAKGMKATMLDLASRMGGLFWPHAVFPPMLDPEFLALNRARVRRIQDNNLTVARALARLRRPRRMVVRAYHHGMYFTLEPPDQTVRERWVASLSQLTSEVEARVAPSFGHDLAVMSGYREQANRWVLRVALPDWDDQRRRAFCGVMTSWLR